MSISKHDMDILRPLAGRYSEIANLEVQQERLDRYRRTNALEQVRPVVLISEIPWGEFDDDALVCKCEDKRARGMEGNFRRTLYQWEHFQVDTVIPPCYAVSKRTRSTGIGLQAHDTALLGDSGSHIAAHEYEDLLSTEEDLDKLQIPEISYNAVATEQSLEYAQEVFDGLLPVKLSGHGLCYSIWDSIAMYRGVEPLLMDLVMRPEFMHQAAQKFADIAEALFRQYEELDLLESDSLYVHCTVAHTDELPAKDFAGKVRMKDTWGRCAAQIFGSVSPAMHDEFDLAYNEKLFGDCGMVYYGCCEQMDTKVDILRKRFRNLRKISISPWADADVAADNIGKDYVLAAKPNPALVSRPTFDPKPVEEEITRYMEACKRNNTPCEFVIKDISTVANNPDNLTQWAATVKGVIDKYYE